MAAQEPGHAERDLEGTDQEKRDEEHPLKGGGEAENKDPDPKDPDDPDRLNREESSDSAPPVQQGAREGGQAGQSRAQ